VTVIELIERSRARLAEAGVSFGHGATNAFDEAAWLVLWRLGLPIDGLDGVADRACTPGECEAADALVSRRITSRRPAAYLTGEAWLQGLAFHADERAIVPRSLIAEPLADGVIDAWLGGEPASVLDLCTGGGSLAVLAALAWPRSRVVATDLSGAALELAASNLRRHGVDQRVELRQGDGLEPVAGERFDLVLCNPPYVNEQAMDALPPEYRAEPRVALAGGADGMDFIRPLLHTLPSTLESHGLLVLEIGQEQLHFEHAFPRLECAWLPTSAGDDAVLLATREALVAGAAS
jgi:ribosomal protein L3 glutamine methyltransferase